MTTLVIRFLVGGIVVSLFSLIAEVIGPKSLAGVFGAAPSVGIATLGLTVLTEGKQFAAQEGRAMIAGAIAFLIYARCCAWLLSKHEWGTTKVTAGLLTVWMASAFGIWFAALK
jgi:hypothetical protein